MSDTSERLLVTGGAGFIGSNLIRTVLRRCPGWEVVNYDLLTYAGNRASLADVDDDPRYTFIQGDIRDASMMCRALAGCTRVIHLAAESHVDRSIHDAKPFMSTNAVGTQVLLDACREVGSARRIVHVGTDEVYGSLPLDKPALKFSEQSMLRPNSPYSASKAASDLIALAHHRTYGLPIIVTRCSNNFGPYQFPEKVIPLFVTNLIDGQKVPLYGDGLNVRDWIHVLDHCDALLRVLEAGVPGEIYNIGGDNEQSNIDLTHSLLRLFRLGEDMIEPVQDRPGHDRRYAIDGARIRGELDWTPTRSSWPDGLTETVAWYRQNEHWWRPLKSGAFNATMLEPSVLYPANDTCRTRPS